MAVTNWQMSRFQKMARRAVLLLVGGYRRACECERTCYRVSVADASHTPPNRISLLALDVDGTLVTDANEVLPKTRAAVHRADREGLAVVLATGRRYRTTCRVMEQLGLELPAVCLGGALVKSALGETLHSEPFSSSQIERLLVLARRRGQALILQRDSAGRGGADFVVDSNPSWNAPTRYYSDFGGDSGAKDPAPERRGYDDILVVGTFGDRDELRRLEMDFSASGEFTTVLVESKRTPGWYLETILGHVDKWASIRRFAAATGIPEDAVCAVGDAANDLPMIRGAAFGVAMGNADPVVKQAADWITDSNEENGVASLVDRLLGCTRGGSGCWDC